MQENDLLNAIKNDDLNSFTALVNENAEYLKLAYGRFPVLSLCYLFNAKKILSKFQKSLLSIVEFNNTYEPFSLSMHFNSLAKKSLQLYSSEKNKKVLPLEMLAILSKNHKLKKLYIKNSALADKEYLKKIYELNYKQKISFRARFITFYNRPITRYQKSLMSKGILISLLSIILTITSIIALPMFSNGGNKQTSPLKISKTYQLYSLSSEDKFYFSLENDINFNKHFESFNGYLNGNNNTIIISSLNDTLFNKMNGVIENVNFLIKSQSLKINNSKGLLFNEINGEFKNCTITLENTNINIDKTSTDEITQVALVTLKNNGVCENINLNFNINAISNIESDVYLSVFCQENNSNLLNIKTSNASIYANKIDLCGVCYENNGTISKNTLNTSLTEETSHESWNPIVNGICHSNQGTIEECVINNNLTSKSQNSTDAQAVTCGISYENNTNGVIANCQINSKITTQANNYAISCGISSFNYFKIDNCIFNGEIVSISNKQMYVSGINIKNEGLIDNCENKGKILSKSNETNVQLETYVAGISCLNNSQVNNCKNSNEIKIEKSKNAFLGGICNLNYSTILNCSNIGALHCNSKDINYVGGICSFNYYKINMSKNLANITTLSENNYIYAGGIIGYGTNYGMFQYSIIYECYSNCNINFTTYNSNYGFAGGIAGYSLGSISKTYSLNTYTFSNKKCFAGGIIGLLGLNSIIDEDKTNLYVKQDNFENGVAKILYNNTIYDNTEENLKNDGTKNATMQEITQSEVYWQ